MKHLYYLCLIVILSICLSCQDDESSGPIEDMILDYWQISEILDSYGDEIDVKSFFGVDEAYFNFQENEIFTFSNDRGKYRLGSWQIEEDELTLEFDDGYDFSGYFSDIKLSILEVSANEIELEDVDEYRFKATKIS